MGFAENHSENAIVPMLGTSFDSLGETYVFYNLYSWEKGSANKIWEEEVECGENEMCTEFVCGRSGSC